MKHYRLNRLFNPLSQNCFDIALDHGFFGEYAFLQGIENLENAVKQLVTINPDAIQLSVGQAQYLQSIAGKHKPALVLRSDAANIYGISLPDYFYCRMIEEPHLQAVRFDAACIVINLFRVPGSPKITDHCIQNIMKLKPLCDLVAMPLMIEPIAFKPDAAGGYAVNGDAEHIISLVRQAVELGADLVKADPTDDPEDFQRVVEIAGTIPVLARGGGKVSDDEVLKRTEVLMQQGARGIVYGRNIIQHPNPSGITQALRAIVHDKAKAAEARKLLK